MLTSYVLVLHEDCSRAKFAWLMHLSLSREKEEAEVLIMGITFLQWTTRNSSIGNKSKQTAYAKGELIKCAGTSHDKSPLVSSSLGYSASTSSHVISINGRRPWIAIEQMGHSASSIHHMVRRCIYTASTPSLVNDKVRWTWLKY